MLSNQRFKALLECRQDVIIKSIKGEISGEETKRILKEIDDNLMKEIDNIVP